MIINALVASKKITLAPVVRNMEVMDTALPCTSAITTSTTGASSFASPSVIHIRPFASSSYVPTSQIIRRITESPATPQQTRDALRTSGGQILIMPPKGSGRSLIAGTILSKEEQLKKEKVTGGVRKRRSYSDERYNNDATKDMLEVTANLFGDAALLNAVWKKSPGLCCG